MSRTFEIHGSDKPAVVDDEDYEWVTRRPWRLSNGSVSCERNVRLGHQKINLGRLVLQKTFGVVLDHDTIVEHQNGDIFDCRRENLRQTTRELKMERERAAKRLIRPERPEYHFFRPGHVLVVCQKCWNGLPVSGELVEWQFCECRNLAVREWQAAAKDPELTEIVSRSLQ